MQQLKKFSWAYRRAQRARWIRRRHDHPHHEPFVPVPRVRWQLRTPDGAAREVFAFERTYFRLGGAFEATVPRGAVLRVSVDHAWGCPVTPRNFAFEALGSLREALNTKGPVRCFCPARTRQNFQRAPVGSLWVEVSRSNPQVRTFPRGRLAEHGACSAWRWQDKRFKFLHTRPAKVTRARKLGIDRGLHDFDDEELAHETRSRKLWCSATRYATRPARGRGTGDGLEFSSCWSRPTCDQQLENLRPSPPLVL